MLKQLANYIIERDHKDMGLSGSDQRTSRPSRSCAATSCLSWRGRCATGSWTSSRRRGGHLGSSLGATELTIALHYVFNTPEDKIVWDTGHQTYGHKLLTGRQDRFDTIRQMNGLSGFLRRDESIYDAFGAGHASTAISAALGMAVARDQNKQDHRVVAIVSDGCITGGMSFEALQNAGHLGKDLLVVLNDNEMFISNRVGALGRVSHEASDRRAGQET